MLIAKMHIKMFRKREKSTVTKRYNIGALEDKEKAEKYRQQQKHISKHYSTALI